MHSESLRRNLNVILCNAIKKPTIAIESFDNIDGPDYALVFSSLMNTDFSFEEYNEAVAEATDGHFSIEPNTLLSIDGFKKPLFRCIARGNVESVPYNEQEVKSNFKESVRANLFLDKSDKMWKLEGDGENRRLVRVSREDYEAILDSKRSRSPVISSFDATINFDPHDYVYFFNHETKAMDFGFAVERNGKDYVFTRATETLVPLKSPMQVIVAHQEKDPKRDVSIAHRKMVIASDYSFSSYLEYVKSLYGADSPYYKALEIAMKSYAGNDA